MIETNLTHDSASRITLPSQTVIRGKVFVPVDNPGYGVKVEHTLQDYYYQIDNSTSPPRLYYGPNPNSQNLTNDGYNSWKTK